MNYYICDVVRRDGTVFTAFYAATGLIQARDNAWTYGEPVNVPEKLEISVRIVYHKMHAVNYSGCPADIDWIPYGYETHA